MRISDWSSDVCSSDLIEQDGVRHVTLASLDRLLAIFGFIDVKAEAFENLARHHAHNFRIIDDQARLHVPAPASFPVLRTAPLLLSGRAAPGRRPRSRERQSGRASGRESVCQYV